MMCNDPLCVACRPVLGQPNPTCSAPTPAEAVSEVCPNYPATCRGCAACRTDDDHEPPCVCDCPEMEAARARDCTCPTPPLPGEWHSNRKCPRWEYGPVKDGWYLNGRAVPVDEVVAWARTHLGNPGDGIGHGCTMLCRPARHAFYCDTGAPTP